MRTGCWNWIVILSKKRIPVNYWKILSQYTVKTTKIDRQRFETFCPRKTSDSFDKYDNKQTCTWSSWQASLPFAVFFFKDQRKKDGSDFEPDTISSFQKTPASHWRANTYSALLTEESFSTWCICILILHFQRKPCAIVCEPVKSFIFWRLSNDCQIICPALVSGFLNQEAI